jgi:transposase-like protein
MRSGSRPFQPPFCPHRACRFHTNPRGWRYVRWGTYQRRCPRVLTVPRFRCSHCRRTFSRQTFQTTYWLRRTDLQATILERLLSGSGFRQIARFLRCSPTTVMTHLRRLGRQLLLYHELHRPKAPPEESLVIDGFESFAYSQYHPLHVNLAVGAESHFVYAFTESELRRKGRMTAAQKEKRHQSETAVGRPDPRAVEQGIRTLLELVVPEGSHVTIRSDEHPAYPRALAGLPGRTCTHARTSSKRARVPSNPLFPVNRQDQMLRHTGANHRRETIAFSKLRMGVIERVAIQVVFMNYLKSFSEKRQDATPAQRLGRLDRKITVREVLRERLFPVRIPLPEVWQTYYDREVPTRKVPNAVRHRLRYAY